MSGFKIPLYKEAKVAEAARATYRDVDADAFAQYDSTAKIHATAIIGSPGEWIGHPSQFLPQIHAGVVVRELVRVHAGCERPTIVGRDTLLMSGSHIGHDAQIGERCQVAPNAVVGGCVTIGNDVKVGMNASILPFIKVGDRARIGAGSVVTKDVPEGVTVMGNPARAKGKWPA